MSLVVNQKSPRPSVSSDLLDKYMSEAKTNQLLSKEDETLLLKKAANGDLGARQQLIAANLRFVVKIAHEYKGYKIPLVDLIQEGNIGLLQAVDKFDPAKGCRLITYAVFWIRSAIQEFIMRNWSMVKIGTTSTERRLFYKVKSLSNQDTATRDEREHRIGQLAKSVGAAQSDVKILEQRISHRDYSLAPPLNNQAGSSSEFLIPDHRPIPDEFLAQAQVSQKSSELIDQARQILDEREREILASRLLAEDRKPLRELSEKFQVSKERIRQLEVKIKDKIADFVNSQEAAAEFRGQY